MTVRRALLLFPLLLLLAVARAQEAAEPNQPAPESGAATEESPARASEDSPFDYEASEQISEDLSVSFPIDI